MNNIDEADRLQNSLNEIRHEVLTAQLCSSSEMTRLVDLFLRALETQESINESFLRQFKEQQQ